jgi:putative two-component system response regulator
MTDQLSIVVADDDIAARTALRAALEREGHRVRDVDNGADALAEIVRWRPDVALLDIGMSDLDGLDVTRALRQAPSTALLPIILVTDRGGLEEKVAGLDAGASDFITKPFEPAELLVRVRANLRLSAAMKRLESSQDLLVALANAVDAKDPLTEQHCGRVADRALLLAGLVGLDQEETEAIGYGAVLHDIGKIGIDEAVLAKPGTLTDEERREMQRHPIIGAGILQPLHLGRIVGPIVRAHHERWDGGGYPDGLRGEAIPIGARIVAVADAFDAMLHDRPYRARRSVDEAREELYRNSGTQFDPEIVELMLASLDDGPSRLDGPAYAFTRGLRSPRGPE